MLSIITYQFTNSFEKPNGSQLFKWIKEMIVVAATSIVVIVNRYPLFGILIAGEDYVWSISQPN